MISSAELLLTLVVAAPVPVVDTLPPDAVVSAVRSAFAERLGTEADALHLEWGRLPFWPTDSGALTVRLGPASTGGWLIATVRGDGRGPVAVRVRAGVLAKMPVASRAMERGHVIGADDVEWSETVAWGRAAAAPTTGLPIGWEVSRAVAAGQPLGEDLLQSPRVIDAGDRVAFVWQRGAVRLERIATALSAARLGDPVRGRAGEVQLVGRATGPGSALLGSGSQ